MVSEILNLDPSFIRNLTLGQLFGMPFIRERFTPEFVRSVVAKHVDQSLDSMDASFLISMVLDFMKQNRQQPADAKVREKHHIHECPYCKHLLVIED